MTEEVRELLLEAGSLLKARYFDPPLCDVKARRELVTETDREIGRMIVQRLRKLLPGDGRRGEDLNRAQGHSGGNWIIDPIDGTSNFVNGLPYFALSVALLRGGRPLLAATFDPVADGMFYAEAGRGAWLNGVALPIKERAPALAAAMACVDLKRLPQRVARQLAEHPPYYSQRNFGASALDWCYTAAGRFDVYAHGGQKLWDYAAGTLILAEAGGSMCTLDNDRFWETDPWQRSVIAARDPELFADWKKWLRALA